MSCRPEMHKRWRELCIEDRSRLCKLTGKLSQAFLRAACWFYNDAERKFPQLIVSMESCVLGVYYCLIYKIFYVSLLLLILHIYLDKMLGQMCISKVWWFNSMGRSGGQNALTLSLV